jgi:hypothetical protein
VLIFGRPGWHTTPLAMPRKNHCDLAAPNSIRWRPSGNLRPGPPLGRSCRVNDC